MSKLLVVDPQRQARRGLLTDLGKLGYDVQEAATAQAGLEAAFSVRFDGILLDAQMTVANDWKVLAKLKENPQTERVPIIMLMSNRSSKIEDAAMQRGASHFIGKPWHPDNLALIVRVALRETQTGAKADRAVEERLTPEESLTELRETTKKPKLFDTGSKLMKLEQVLGGGIRPNTLTLVEDSPGTGKSVICQYLIYGAIAGGANVTLFSTDHDIDSLATQMGSIDLDLSQYLIDGPLDGVQEGRLQVHGLERSPNEDPEALLRELGDKLENVQAKDGLIVVDSISGLVQVSQDRAILAFFAKCLNSCQVGKTIVLTSRESSFDQHLISRINGICNNHIKLGAETVGGRFINTLEVRKLNNAETRKDNRFGFQMVPGVGINVIPVSRIKA